MKWYFRILLTLAIAVSVVAIFIDTNVWDYLYVLVQANWELIVYLLFLGLFKLLYWRGLLEISQTEYYGSLVCFWALIASSLVNITHGIFLYLHKSGIGEVMKCEYYQNMWLPYWQSMFWYWMIFSVLFLIGGTFLCVSAVGKK